jgi:hypothetical protein
MRPPSARFLALLAVMLLAWTGPVAAQTCGDADGSGAVTVTDGVQTLRAAAGLSSSCTAATCDVDGSGSITVTDGVNVLRKAEGLSAPSACPGGSSGDGVQVAVDSVVPFLAFGLQFVSDVGLATTAAATPAGQGEDACPDGGTRTKQFLGSPEIIRIGFNACRYSQAGLGRFQFDGGLAVNFFRFQVSLLVDVTDVDSGRLVHFEKFFDFEPRDGGGFIARVAAADGGTGGPILLTTPQGNFLLTLNDLEIDADGHAVAGGGSIAEETKPGNFALDEVDFQVTNAITTATLTATFDDGHTENFVVNLLTGDVSPA